jgi:hypothetical protein
MNSIFIVGYKIKHVLNNGLPMMISLSSSHLLYCPH